MSGQAALFRLRLQALVPLLILAASVGAQPARRGLERWRVNRVVPPGVAP